MRYDRRQFVRTVTTAALSLPFASCVTSRASLPSRKRVLFLGGTNFIGPAIVTALLSRGHEVTLFNRGKTNPQLFPDLEKLRGNRFPELDNGLAPLRSERRWDVVIDTCGFLPRIVKESVALLGPRIDQYIYISTGGVYLPGAVDEDSPLREMPDETFEGEMPMAYVVRKAACDRAVRRMLPDQATVVRPYIITGPRNPDRTYFTYWPARAGVGGEALAPGSGDDPILYIDSRDMADWIVNAIEHRHLGAYNMTGPGTCVSLADYLTACNEMTGRNTTWTWVDEEFLRRAKMASFGKLPMWRPRAPEVKALRAVATGLRYRPLRALIAEEYARSQELFPKGYEFGEDHVAMTRAQEAELLAAWHRYTLSVHGPVHVRDERRAQEARREGV